jgi:chromatin remodeling complex protein RSC6
MAAKTPAKKTTTAKKKTATTTTRKPNAAFMKPMQPDAVLAAVVGSKPVPRTQVVKKLWEYIKANNLQDKKQKTMINADDKLKEVFGGKKQVSMFEMTKLVNKHLGEAK